MDGFAQGVEYYNEQKGTDVQVLGWDVAAQTARSPVASRPAPRRQTARRRLIDQDADVLLPVGGPIYQSAAEAIRDSGREIALIGVDADLYETDPTSPTCSSPRSSRASRSASTTVVEPRLPPATSTTSPYVGTLENDGVGLAPFHDFEAKVAARRCRASSTTITAGIIDGSITVDVACVAQVNQQHSTRRGGQLALVSPARLAPGALAPARPMAARRSTAPHG